MNNPILFVGNGVLLDGAYLPGQYGWHLPVRLDTAMLTCRAPSSGTLVLTLEVNGQLTPLAFTVPGPCGRPAGACGQPPGFVTQTLPLGLTLAANSVIRWKASFDGPPEAAATSAALQISPIARPNTAAALSVRWVNQQEKLVLFCYDLATHLFLESVPGLSSNRTAIVTGSLGVTVSLQGVAALEVSNSRVRARSFFAGGSLAPADPRLEFCVDGQRIASLSAGGLWVTDLFEAAPTVLTANYDAWHRRFEFYSDGSLTATLAAAGLTAPLFEEADL